ARRILEERAAQGRDLTLAGDELHKLLHAEQPVDRKLRLIWALHAIGRADNEFLLGLLDDQSEYVRAWAIRLLTEKSNPPDSTVDRFAELAKTDKSGFVCLHLASALQRLNPAATWRVAEPLV